MYMYFDSKYPDTSDE